MKKNKISTALLLLVSVIMLASCCACRKKSKNPLMLDSVSWALIELNSKAVDRQAEEKFVLRFDGVDKKISGFADCNRFFGTYNLIPSNRIKFDKMGSTRMMCENMDVESDFLKSLADVDSYTIDKDVLLLQEKGEVIMIFDAIKSDIKLAQ